VVTNVLRCLKENHALQDHVIALSPIGLIGLDVVATLVQNSKLHVVAVLNVGEEPLNFSHC
jgi:hypothetical protein